MSNQTIQTAIAKLVQYGLSRGLLEPLDEMMVTNALLDLMHVNEPWEGGITPEVPDDAVSILELLLDYAADNGTLPDNTITYRDLLDARIMGLLMPRPSEVAARFWQTAEEQTIQEATSRYYQMSLDSNYIRMDRIRKNEYWLTPTEYGELEMTINLSKPEKDPREIAAERSLPQSSYPKCLLCLENVGYAGRLNHPARQNHRVIPLQLTGEPWYFQYSPYVYYNEHSIIFSENHVPMQVTPQSIARLLDFVGQFPHYFIGSNADLPIVGGSILGHDHFQGGQHRFPMEKAGVDRIFIHPDYPDVRAGIVRWPMSVIRLTAQDGNALLPIAVAILANWRGYEDEAADIQAFSSAAAGLRTPHNTITPIARRNVDGEYELDLVLRNNRTSAEHPDGIFHPHTELHHIKKENIGLIEVMGLAVLPGRLKQELEQIQAIVEGNLGRRQEEDQGKPEWKDNREHPLYKHADWIDYLLLKFESANSDPLNTAALLQYEVGVKFLQVLADAGVYKQDEQGQHAFARFMKTMGFRAE